jgi:serine/threonine protein kinase
MGTELIQELIQDYSFRGFVKKMLAVDPEKRPTATEMLEHEFLKRNYDIDSADGQKRVSESTSG